MDSFKEKHIKDQINEALHCSINSECEPDSSGESTYEPIFNSSQENNPCKKSLETIKDIFQKTEAMKEAAKEKNQQIEEQLQNLKQKLSSSSEYLLRIKKNIENLKYSYQKNVLDLHNKLDPGACLESDFTSTKDEMAKHMEDIRTKIDELQNRMMAHREKQQHVTESYEQAFNRVVDTLQEIESGSYSSQVLNVNHE